METHLIRTKYLLVLGLLILVIASAAIFGRMPVNYGAKGQEPERKRVTKMPLIISKVKKLEIVSATVEWVNGTDPEAVLVIRNNSDLAVMSVTVSTGDFYNSSSVGVDGLGDPDNPIVIIEPHETRTLRMAFSAMLSGFPLELNAVTFSDGTEEGVDWAVSADRIGRGRAKKRHGRRRGAHNNEDKAHSVARHAQRRRRPGLHV